MNAPIRVVLIDDHTLCRKGLSELLEKRAGMQVVGLTGSPDEALSMLMELKPDLAVMDLRMPQMDGLSLLRRFRREGCDTPVLILTVSDAQEDLANVLAAGARGYLLKDMEPDDVIEAIQRAARGELVLAPAMTVKLARMLQDAQKGNGNDDLFYQLTEREHEILEQLAHGKTNKTIAKALGISNDTVKLHVSHILAKLHLTSRVEAAVFAVEHRANSTRSM